MRALTLIILLSFTAGCSTLDEVNETLDFSLCILTIAEEDSAYCDEYIKEEPREDE